MSQARPSRGDRSALKWVGLALAALLVVAIVIASRGESSGAAESSVDREPPARAPRPDSSAPPLAMPLQADPVPIKVDDSSAARRPWRSAKPERGPLYRAMIRASELIVVGEVLSLSQPEGQPCVATLKTAETWRGDEQELVSFIASPATSYAGRSDHSTARIGEHVVLFLARDEHGDLRIAAGGNGRLPLRSIGRSTYATFREPLGFPDELVRSFDVRNMVDDPYGIGLPDLESLVDNELESAAAAAEH